MVLDADFLNTQQFKEHIKCRVEQSRAKNSAFPYALVLCIIYWKGGFGLPSTTAVNFNLLYIYIYIYIHTGIDGIADLSSNPRGSNFPSTLVKPWITLFCRQLWGCNIGEFFFSLALVKQPLGQKENSELKAAKFSLNIGLVSHSPL